MATTKTIQGVTYHQDPTDPQRWFNNPDLAGAGLDTCEIYDMHTARRDHFNQLQILDEDALIADAHEQIRRLDEEIALLVELAA